jgi:AGZA family xanthine/uracil permease-like MFS transporter
MLHSVRLARLDQMADDTPVDPAQGLVCEVRLPPTPWASWHTERNLHFAAHVLFETLDEFIALAWGAQETRPYLFREAGTRLTIRQMCPESPSVSTDMDGPRPVVWKARLREDRRFRGMRSVAPIYHESKVSGGRATNEGRVTPHAGRLMKRYTWAQWGDVNAFFGLMLDNLAVMVLLVSIIAQPLAKQTPGDPRFTPEFVMTRMIPGTALGVLIGDLIYTLMAFRLARRTGNSEVTAMPLGLDTPSTFGVALLVLLPALKDGAAKWQLDHDQAMLYGWHVGVAVLVIVGAFKCVCAPFGNLVQRLVPRAGLLGSLAAIALALIAFIPLLRDIAAVPLVGFLCLTVILITLVAHRELPGKIPGALAAVVAGVAAYYLFVGIGQAIGFDLVPPHLAGNHVPAWSPPPLLPASSGDAVWWSRVFRGALDKLPIVLPFALATIVGGLDCTESAHAAGDEYDTRSVLLTEGAASVLAGCLGGVIQTTPYIGHPAYKKMGGRAAYTLATALFIGAAGYFGWFGVLFAHLPAAAMFPILVFVGLEITAQSFQATPTKHYAALALAVLPALAYLVTIPVRQALGGRAPAGDEAARIVQTLFCLANGFIVTSLLWAAALASLLDGHLPKAAAYLLICAACAFFGVIHSPLPDAAIGLPGHVLAEMTMTDALRYQTPYHWTGAYLLAAGLLIGLSFVRARARNHVR